MKRMFVAIVALALVAGATAQEGQPAGKDPAATEEAMKSKAQGAAPAATQATGSGLKPHVTLETTLGNIVLELDGEKAPISVQNFLAYVDSGFYTNTIFHRVIPNFMIQGGGFDTEVHQKDKGLLPPIKNEWQNGLKNVKGTIAMARTAAPDSATAQFFINVVDNAMLDQPRGGAAYAVFGKVVEGGDVVEKIRTAPRSKHPNYPTDPQGAVTPDPLVVITAAKVTQECDRAALAEKVEQQKKTLKSPGEMQEAKDQALLPQVIAQVEKETGKQFQTTPSGLMYVVVKEGAGDPPAATDRISAHYTGKFLDGKQFDSSAGGDPIQFSLQGGVIQGWLEAASTMKKGEKRILIIPYKLAYGERGHPAGIPPRTTLMFEMEIVDIQK